MLYNVFKVLISVRAKLFFGFFAMVMLIVMLGGYAFLSINSAGKVVTETYDRPLMAINYARSASQVLAQVKIEAQELRLLDEAGGTPNGAKFQSLRETFQADLAIAKERSIAPRAAEFFEEVDRLRFEWQALSNGQAIMEPGERQEKSKEYYNQIAENLDIIVELQTNESFRNREAAIAQMEKIKRYSLYAILAALGLTALFSTWIAVTIINPLKAAATAARKISAGNLDARIPKGGLDETGALLKTMQVMQKNIRTRMATEQESRALAQVRLAESLENSKDAVMLTDADGKVIVANGALKTMFPNLAKTDLINQPYVDYFEITGLSKTEPCVLHADLNELEFEDGRWARVNASNTQEGGRLIIWTAITQSKEREVRLREAKENAEAASKSKSLFLATMSHELRTPLNAVIGFSNMIATERLGKIANEKYVEVADLIHQSGAHLLHVVKDVLTIADGRNPDDMESNMKPLDLYDVMGFCTTSVQKTAQGKGVKIIAEERGAPLMVMGDRVRLQQMGLNVLSNAIKFNKPGGFVKVVVGARTDKAVRIDFIDSGIGISSDNIDKITQPFVQVDNGNTRQYEGVGLGLSIVQKWVMHHKGKMSIRSEVGKGTIISIALPLMPEEASFSTEFKKAG